MDQTIKMSKIIPDKWKVSFKQNII